MIALAVLAGVIWTRREAKKAGQNPEKVWEILPWVLAGGLVGARLYHVAHYWWYYSQDLGRIFQVWHGGLALYGGLGGGLVGLLAYNLKSIIYNLKFKRENFRSYLLNFRFYLDLAAPGIALGQAVGRLGNVVNGELLPFAIYESAWNFLIFVLLVRLVKLGEWDRGKKQRGQRFLVYLLFYAVGRFFLEFMRTDDVWRWGALSAAQGVSLGIIGLIGLIRLISLICLGGRAGKSGLARGGFFT